MSATDPFSASKNLRFLHLTMLFQLDRKNIAPEDDYHVESPRFQILISQIIANKCFYH